MVTFWGGTWLGIECSLLSHKDLAPISHQPWRRQHNAQRTHVTHSYWLNLSFARRTDHCISLKLTLKRWKRDERKETLSTFWPILQLLSLNQLGLKATFYHQTLCTWDEFKKIVVTCNTHHYLPASLCKSSLASCHCSNVVHYPLHFPLNHENVPCEKAFNKNYTCTDLCVMYDTRLPSLKNRFI